MVEIKNDDALDAMREAGRVVDAAAWPRPARRLPSASG